MTRLVVKRLGGLGDGLADQDGPVVVVPYALPGEDVEGDVRDGVLYDLRIVTPSPHRVKPPCKQFRRCGGCALQHADDATVADWKRAQVRDALARVGITAPEAPVLTSPPRSRIRATLAGRRTKKGAQVGFHARASDKIVSAEGCSLIHEDLLSALPLLSELTTLLASRKAEVSMALTRSDTGLDIDITGAKAPDVALGASLANLIEQYRVARLTVNSELVAMRPAPSQTLGRVSVTPPPGAFLQATDQGRDALVSFATEALAGAGRVADLFSGLGTFTLPLAASSEVSAFESDASMIAALDAGWRSGTGLKAVSAQVRDLFRRPLLASEIEKFDAILLDPPRAGAKAQTEELAKSRVARIVHVSCNPATFARDAATLTKGGYRLERLIVVDQFRWSSHVELASLFTRPA